MMHNDSFMKKMYDVGAENEREREVCYSEG